jgi:hypothetical protein
MSRGPRRVGRPSVIDQGYDEHVGTWSNASPAGKVLTSIRGGAYLENAAIAAGFTAATLRRLIVRGSAALAALTDDQLDQQWSDTRKDVPRSERKYADFAREFQIADANVKTRVEVLAGRDVLDPDASPGARLHYMSVRWPKDWSPKHQVEASVDVKVSPVLGLLNDPETRKAAMELGKRLALANPEAVLDLPEAG